MIIYLPRRKNKRRKHIRIPGSPERLFFCGGGFWVENEKVWARPKNIHRTIFPGNIYIYTYFQGGAPASEYFILRCFQQLSGATHPPILLVLMFWGYWVPWGHWLHCFLERLIWEPWRLLRDALVLHILQGWKKTRDTWRDVCSLSWKSKCFTFFGFIEWWLPQTPKIDPF